MIELNSSRQQTQTRLLIPILGDLKDFSQIWFSFWSVGQNAGSQYIIIEWNIDNNIQYCQ